MSAPRGSGDGRWVPCSTRSGVCHLGTPQPIASPIRRGNGFTAGGDLVAAGRWADDAAAMATGSWLMWALTTRARVAIAQGEPDEAERDAHDALAGAADDGKIN